MWMSEISPAISMQLPRTLAFGAGCAERCAAALAPYRNVFAVTGKSTRALAGPIELELKKHGAQVSVWDEVRGEPTIATLREALSAARDARADAVIGLGGGSPMDVAKLVAALVRGEQDIG